MLCILAVGTTELEITRAKFSLRSQLGSTPACQQGWGFFAKPNLGHVGTSLWVGPHLLAGDSGKGSAMDACVCWGLVIQVCSWTATLWRSQQTWAPGFGRDEVVTGCDFHYFWSLWHGENKWWDGIPLHSYLSALPWHLCCRTGSQLTPKASVSGGEVGFIPRLQLYAYLAH